MLGFLKDMQRQKDGGDNAAAIQKIRLSFAVRCKRYTSHHSRNAVVRMEEYKEGLSPWYGKGRSDAPLMKPI